MDYSGVPSQGTLRGDETPETFKPYGVGLVQLGDEVRVEARLTESDPDKLQLGMDVELVVVPFRVDADGTEVLVHAFAACVKVHTISKGTAMYDVAIVGVGLHPFGRFGDKTAIEMGAEAVAAACLDAGIGWSDVQFAFGGSADTDFPDAIVGLLGMTGIPFTDVYNGCATGASTLSATADAIRLGKYHLGVAVGMDKHVPGAFTGDPRVVMAPVWYGEIGQFLTTKFFGMKINRYMQTHGISVQTLARVAAKNYRNGSLNQNAFRRKRLSEEEILSSQMLNYPLTAVHVLCAE